MQFGSRNSSQNPNGMKIISFPPRGVGLVGSAECIRKFPGKKRIGGAFCMHDLLVTFAFTSTRAMEPHGQICANFTKPLGTPCSRQILLFHEVRNRDVALNLSPPSRNVLGKSRPKAKTLFAPCQCAQSYLKGEDLSWKYEVGLAHATHYAEL